MSLSQASDRSTERLNDLAAHLDSMIEVNRVLQDSRHRLRRYVLTLWTFILDLGKHQDIKDQHIKNQAKLIDLLKGTRIDQLKADRDRRVASGDPDMQIELGPETQPYDIGAALAETYKAFADFMKNNRAEVEALHVEADDQAMEDIIVEKEENEKLRHRIKMLEDEIEELKERHDGMVEALEFQKSIVAEPA